MFKVPKISHTRRNDPAISTRSKGLTNRRSKYQRTQSIHIDHFHEEINLFKHCNDLDRRLTEVKYRLFPKYRSFFLVASNFIR